MRTIEYSCDVCEKTGANSAYFWPVKLDRGGHEHKFDVCDLCWDGPKKNLFQKLWQMLKRKAADE